MTTILQDEAARWVARMDGSGWSDEDEASLAEWLRDNPSGSGALLRAQAVWVALDPRDQTEVAVSTPVPAADNDRGVPSVSRRRLMLAGTLAVAASVAGAFYLTLPLRYSTQVGEIRQVALADGSTAAINTDSSISVDYSAATRGIDLDRGEAWFQVTPNKHRPFVVTAGHVQVRAVGTAFSVRRRDDGVEILVSEGVVTAWTRDTPGRPTTATAGTRLFVRDVAAIERSTPQEVRAASALAWRGGHIELVGQTVGEAAAEFNRYNVRQIVVLDPVVASEQVDGVFRTNDPEGFARSAQRLLKVPLDLSGDDIVIGLHKNDMKTSSE